MSVLNDLREKRANLESEIDALISADDFDPNDETFVRAKKDAEALDAKVKVLVENESRRAAANEIDAIAVRTTKAVKQAEVRSTEASSMGQAFTRSREYEDYKQAPRGTSGHVKVSFDMLHQRAPILSDTFAGVLEPQRISPSSAPAIQTPLLDNVARIPVSANSVEWIRYPAAAPLAGKVAEGSAKPEASVSPELVTVTLDIVAHWLQVTRTVMEDGGALMSFIDSALRRGVVDKLEAEVASTITTAAAGDEFATVTYGGAGDGDVDTLLKGIRHGVGAVQDAGYVPSVVLLNPSDFAALDIDVLGSTLLGPQVGSQFWGVRPVAVGAIGQGSAFVGDLSTAVAHLYRTDVSMYVSDSHASTFTSNVLTLLAEARAANIVHRAEALVEVAPGA
jgi:HK97 family phage major capsid protein